MVEQFSYHRAVAPMMWLFVAIAAVELVVVHLLVAWWSRGAAVLLSLASLATIAWLVAAIASMRRRPVLLDPTRLVMRVGTIRTMTVPLANVKGLRADWDAAALKAPGVRNLALIAYPNVLVDLVEPLPGRRRTGAIAHRLDDPAGFARALAARRGAA